MAEFNKLRGRIFELYGGTGAFADAIGKNRRTVQTKLSGKTDFSRSDIEEYCKALDIKRKEIADYFF